MKNNFAILEITNTNVRLIIGGLVDRDPAVIHVEEKPIAGLISRGEILNEEVLTETIATLKTATDENLHARINISDVTLVLPPLGLEIYEAEKTTNVVSPTSVIEHIDIQNVISLVSKEDVDISKEIIDIVPDYFILNGTEMVGEPPIGKVSDTLTVHAKVHILPRHVTETYRRIVENSGIRVTRLCVAPYASTQYIKLLPNMPKNYLLLDMGANITNITLVGNDSPFFTTNAMVGGNDLSLNIANEFGIDEEKATEIKELYGYTERDLKFKPEIHTQYHEDGTKQSFYPTDLNRIILSFLKDEYFSQIDVAVTTLLKGFNESVLKIPLVVVGGFSRLNGIQKLLKEHFTNPEKIIFANSNVLGIRQPHYFPLIGGLITTATYRGALTDQRNKTKIERINRNENK